MTQEEKDFFIEKFRRWNEEYKPSPNYTLDDVEKCSDVVSEEPFGCFVFVPKYGQIIFSSFYGHYEDGKFYSAHVTNGLFSHSTYEKDAKYFVRYRSEDFYNEEEKVESKDGNEKNTIEEGQQKPELKGVAQSGGFFNYTNFSNVQKDNIKESYLLALRNRVAIAAIQGLLSNRIYSENVARKAGENNTEIINEIVEDLVSIADALVEKLKK